MLGGLRLQSQSSHNDEPQTQRFRTRQYFEFPKDAAFEGKSNEKQPLMHKSISKSMYDDERQSSSRWAEIDKAIQDREQSSCLWVPMALAIGVVYSMADVLLSNTKAHYGLSAIGFLGPVNVIGIGIYRVVQAILLKYETGKWIDKENSNYWLPIERPDPEDAANIFSFGSEERQYYGNGLQLDTGRATEFKFNWGNLRFIIFTQAMPLTGSLVFLVYAFKFAILSGLNPGSITTLFSLTSIYVAILFYFCFDEKLTAAKSAGIVLIFACAVILAFDEKPSTLLVVTTTDDEEETVEDGKAMRDYGLLAILMAFCGPLFWTFRSFHAKKALIDESFQEQDLAIDCNFFVGIVQCFVFLYFFSTGGYDHDIFDDLLQGQIIGLCFLIGTVLYISALKIGPGGPIEALVSSNTLLQVATNVVLFQSKFGAYEQVSVTIGILAILSITVGDEFLEYLNPPAKELHEDEEE